jgi:hypothetical protein
MRILIYSSTLLLEDRVSKSICGKRVKTAIDIDEEHFKRPFCKIRIGDSENKILGLFEVRAFGNQILKSCN